MKIVFVTLVLLLLTGCIPMMVVGAGSSIHTKTSLQEIEQRIEKLEKKHKKE